MTPRSRVIVPGFKPDSTLPFIIAAAYQKKQ